MIPEGQRIAIAQACGWKIDPEEIQPLHGWLPGTPTHGMKRDTTFFARLPNYTSDLNAMHEAEKTLIAHSQQDRFVATLWSAIGAGVYGNIDRASQEWIMIHSTAPQRAEAFLRTISKWEY